MRSAGRGEGGEMLMLNLRGAGDRLGDYCWVDCANLPSVSGHNRFADTKYTRPISKLSKSSNASRVEEL